MASGTASSTIGGRRARPPEGVPGSLRRMDNPWRHLPQQPPYVLPPDAHAVASFNQRAGDAHAIRTELLPEPYLGDPAAPIVPLNLNPGFSELDRMLFGDPLGRALCLDNLLHRPMDYPFYLLDPRIAFAPGAKWWRERLGAPIRAAGVEAVATKVCCVEFFPYHSRKYRGVGRILESQRYSFRLVEAAIERRALIVAMRSSKLWCEQVPHLSTYDRLHACANPRRPYISSGNLPAAFPTIERILRG